MNLFLLCFCYSLNSVLARINYDDRPRIYVQNGHLVFYASPYKNISFETSKASGVTINNIDILTTLNKAHDATKLTDNYHRALTTYNDRLDALEDRILQGVPVSVNSSSSNDTMNIVKIRRINRRLLVLERAMINMRLQLYKDECLSNPCQNGATCEDLIMKYRCRCSEGWEGRDCMENINECYRFSGTDLGCQNGATCKDTPGGYECTCAPGWVGLHCTRKKAECITAGKELCGHGVCVEHGNDNGYTCICDQGYTTDGDNLACTKDIDECNQNHPACSVNPKVECRNVPGSYFCGFCPQGYSGNGYNCADIDECKIDNGGCSQNPLVNCINIPGSRICGSCPAGYTGNGVTCTYEGECNQNNGGCHPVATCKYNSGISTSNVECVCPFGYIGDGRGPNGCVMNNQNACASSPCVNGNCTELPAGGYTCKCKGSYTGRNCDVLGRDPCQPNPCLNEGECQNLAYLTFKCKCKSGFSGVLCGLEEAACGGLTKANSGVLKYPNVNYRNYKHYANCAWTIVANDSTKVLNITFKKFDLEESSNCHTNFLEIHDGSNTVAPTKGRFCGNKLPFGGNFTSTHDRLYLWLRSDNGVGRGGFEIEWKAINWKCGGVLRDKHGSIWSPGSPGKYPPRRDCWWRLMAPPGKRFLFTFFSLDIGDNKDCSQDLLQFFTMLDYMRENDKFKRICNSTKPEPFYSPGNEVMIHFHSNLKDTYNGFQLNYLVVESTPGCGGYFTTATGYISSPSTTNDGTTECEYIIEQPAISKIAISFMNFDLGDADCENTFLELFEGNNSSLGRYCGSTIPPSYTSLGNRLRIVYNIFAHNDDSAGAQWKIQYKRICGQKFTNETGFFTPSAYYSSSGTECTYQIERPPGYIIELLLTVKLWRYDMLNRGHTRGCYSYVEVRDGDSESAPLIDKYCGVKSVNITSTHNALWLKLKISPFYYNGEISTFLKAEYTSLKTGCSGILRNSFGYISSPNHVEGGYPPGSKCTWVILAPSNNIIKLSWQTFNVEQSFNCAYDYVKVFNNDTDLGTGEEIGKFCGGTIPPVLFSTSNIMTVVFNSDMTISNGEFLASYVFIKEENACNIHYTSSAGVLKSPKYPEIYPINQECTYTINVPPGQQILLNVTDFDIEFSPGCRYDLLEIRNGQSSSSPLIGKYCGNSTVIPKLIWSHTNKLYFLFKSDISRGATGFSITWSSSTTGCGGTLSSPTGSITSPNYPEPYNRNAECTWKIVVNSGSRIQAYFSDINLENYAECLADYVQLFDGLTKNSRSLGKFCFDSEGPITSTTNKLLVKFRSDVNLEGRGFNMRYTTICHNIIRGFYGVIESPNFPNSYPQSQNCLWEIIVPEKNKINITFSHFELERELILSNVTCQFDFVEIKYADGAETYSDEDEELQTYAKYCGNNNPGHLSINSDHVAIHFVSDKLLVGSGFRLEWEIWGCGGLLTKNSGTISSPNYPKPYPPSISCEWKIEVDYGYSIQIEFHEIDIERVDNCNFDYVKIYDGPNNDSNVITTICKQKKTAVLSSTGNLMYIEFKADYSYQGKGFFANYSSIPTSCGGRLTAESGSIYSPNYPQNYNRNESCGWLIDVDEGSSVELIFEDVDLYEIANCTINYVKVHDGPTEAYPVLAKVCGTSNPNDTITSTYNHMYIAFRTHTYITTKGFKATYRKSCGSKITTQSNGIIEIEKNEFADAYKKCVWTISSTDLTGHVYLLISTIHGTEYCDSDDSGKPVKVYNGDSSSAPLMGSYCDEKIPTRFVSDGSSITVELDNPQISFIATYSVFESECGGSLLSEGGYFASPGYPKTYPSGAQCEWTVQVSPGNRMSLNFLTFDLPASGCDTDYLEMRAENSSGPIIGIYCGTNKPTNITNVGPLWLLFKSKQLEKGDSVNSKGFHAEYETSTYTELTGSAGKIYSPLYPKPYMKYGTYSWQITVKQRKKILISFQEFYFEADDSENECFFGVLGVYDGVDSIAPTLGTFCGVTNPQPIKSTSNIVFIQANFVNPRMGTKFRIEWMEINEERVAPKVKKNTTCGSDETIDLYALKNYTVSSPGFPNGYGPNLHCTWVFSTIQMNHLFIYFYSVNFGILIRRFQGNNCAFTDYVKVSKKDYDSNDWQLVVDVCRPETTQIQATNLMKVEFITDGYLNGTGFQANVVEVCGGHLTEKSGYIEHLNDTIFASTNCEWNITVGSTKVIEIVFENMYILNSQNDVCENYLLIKNGKYPDSPYLGTGKYCGTSLPLPLKSTGNTLYLKYKGIKPNKSTFRLKYREVSSNLCGGNIILSSFDNSTEISSPNYPNIPKPHSECQWVITAPVGESIRIDFEGRFDLTYSKTCDKEYVELRDGGTEHSPLVGKYCKDKPNTQVTTGNMLFVKFFTDIDDPKNGFKAKIYLGYCGGTIRGNSGSVKLTTLPSDIKNPQCDWYVTGPDDHYLILHFTKFNMDYCTNYNNKTITGVSIFETNFQNKTIKTLIGQYCAKNVDEVPNNITTSSNKISIHYEGSSTGQFTLAFKASQTKCGGNINGESGEITSPGYPDSIHYNRVCFWQIEVPEGRRITVEMIDVDFGPNRQMLTFYDGLNVKLFFKVITLMPENKIIESSSNILMIRYWITGLSNHRGFKLKYTSNNPTICSGDFGKNVGIISNPSVRNTSYSCKWTRRSESITFNQTVAVSISLKTSFTSSVCTRAPGEIQLTNFGNILGRICQTTHTPYIIRSPYIINSLVARVNNRYSMNFTVSYRMHPCGGLLIRQSGTIKSPVFRIQPESVECVWLLYADDGQTINLTVTDLNLGSDCEKSFISVYNGASTRSPHIGKFCGNNKPDTIISQTRSLWIEYRWEKGSTGTGMAMKFEAISQGCSGIFHDRSRIISTPNYSKDYPNNAECLWEVRSLGGYMITLKFIDRFHLEESDGCVNDFLEVFDWNNDKWVSLGKKCGRDTPSEIKSTSNRLRILFRSNSQTTASGFKARWDWHCGGKFEATSALQFLVSPGYPMTYENGLNCVYTIEPKAGKVLRLRFIDFELEGNIPDCRYDNLTVVTSLSNIYGGSANGIYCGDKKPAFIRKKGAVNITFKTDYFLTKRGFKIAYSDESCGGTIDKETIIDSSNFVSRSGGPRYFEPLIQCQWNITAPPKQQVILTIIKLSMTYSSLCYGQHVSVYKSLQMNMTNRLAKMCSQLENVAIVSDTGKMAVSLLAFPMIFQEFHATITFSHGPEEGCGGTVNLTDTEYISSPDLETMDCAWKIIAPQDYIIEIQFSELKFSPCVYANSTQDACYCALLEIRDGNAPFSEIIEKICPTSSNKKDTRTFTTSFNRAYIRFYTKDRKETKFKAKLTPKLSNCGHSRYNVTRTPQILTSPGYPNQYPANTRCTYLFYSSSSYTDRIRLHFIDFELTEESPPVSGNQLTHCTGDTVQIYESANVLTNDLGPSTMYSGGTNKNLYLVYNNGIDRNTFCGKGDKPFDYYTAGRKVVLVMNSLDNTRKGKGFKLEYLLDDCNRNYSESNGHILDNNYRFPLNCTFYITVPENRTISLYFYKFAMKLSTDSDENSFEVRDKGKNGPVLGKFGGYLLPNPVFSSTNVLYISMVSPKQTLGNHWIEFTYTSTDKGRGCGGEMYNIKGKFYSPMYPNQFRNDTECNWIIRVPVGLHTMLKFLSFDIQGSCDESFLEVTTHNSNVQTESATTRFCKNDYPGIIRSETSIEIRYKSSMMNGGAGWIAVFRGVNKDLKNIPGF